MVRFTPIKHMPTYMEIVQQISKMIQNNELKPGEKLPSERTLASDLGVGRQCLREAFSVLQVLGLIEVKKGRGTYVREDLSSKIESQIKNLDIDEIGDPFALMEARRTIETRNAYLAAKMAKKEDLEEMDAILKEMQKLTQRGEHASEQDKKLHLAIAKATQNPVLYKFMNIIIANMGKRLWLTLKERSLQMPKRNDRYYEEHHKLIEAIRQGDSKMAEKIMAQHLNGIVQDLRN